MLFYDACCGVSVEMTSKNWRLSRLRWVGNFVNTNHLLIITFSFTEKQNSVLKIKQEIWIIIKRNKLSENYLEEVVKNRKKLNKRRRMKY